MALFKIYWGTEDQLPKSFHEGYAYFTTDGRNLYIDINNTTRVQVNAGSANNAEFAAALKKTKADGSVIEIDIEDLVVNNDLTPINNKIIALENKTNILPIAPIITNAVLLGNGNDTFKLVATAKGVLQANAVNGVPSFETAGIEIGGTGATDVVNARTNLDVYSKNEVDNIIETISSVCYIVTLYANEWTASGDKYIYNYINANLIAKVPLIITYTSNFEEYSNIENAEATQNIGIVFTTKIQPIADIGIIITDVK